MADRHLDHAAGAPCPICADSAKASRRPDRCTDEELTALYVALDRRGLPPAYLVRELRREGKRLNSLSELSSFEVRKLTRECEKGGAA